MNIIAVSDMHGDLGSVRRIVEDERPDLLLCCGDWGDPGQLSREDYEHLISQVHTLSVFGNHDDLDLLRSLRNADGSPVLLENAVVRQVSGISIAGISGIWAKSNRQPWYITDEEMLAAAERVAGRGIDILMMHGCAVGLCDLLPGGRHGGHRSFLQAFQVVHPRVYLCGHLHSQQVKTLKDGRTAANVGNTAEGEYLAIEHADAAWQVATRTVQT